MKTRNEFLNYGKLFSPEEPDGAIPDDEPKDESIDYKKLYDTQQEAIALLIADKKERDAKEIETRKKAEEKEKKKNDEKPLTRSEMEEFYENKRLEQLKKESAEKLEKYELSPERKALFETFTGDQLDGVLKELDSNKAYKNTPKIGNGKSGGDSLRFTSVDDLLNQVDEV